mgnify:CR=1 FL=1
MDLIKELNKEAGYDVYGQWNIAVSGADFPVHSPSIDHIEVVRNGKVRRAKLYYLRSRVGKGAKVKEKL